MSVVTEFPPNVLAMVQRLPTVEADVDVHEAPPRVVIFGTAGRDKSRILDRRLWDAMLENARELVPAGSYLISGGAAWANHLHREDRLIHRHKSGRPSLRHRRKLRQFAQGEFAPRTEVDARDSAYLRRRGVEKAKIMLWLAPSARRSLVDREQLCPRLGLNRVDTTARRRALQDRLPVRRFDQPCLVHTGDPRSPINGLM